MVGKQIRSPEWLRTQSRRWFTAKSRRWFTTKSPTNRHLMIYGDGSAILMKNEADNQQTRRLKT